MKFNLFASFAEQDAPLALKLLTLLEPHFVGDDFSIWHYHRLSVGESFDERIQTQIDRSDAAFFLISPNFLGSSYIRTKEIPPFLTRDKKALPLLLKRIDLPRQGAAGLEGREIFGVKKRAFAECSTTAQRDAFVLELFRQAHDRLRESGRA